MNQILNGLLIALLSAAVITDLRFHKIYNGLTGPALALGLLLHAVQNGGSGLLFSLSGIGVAGLALPFFLTRMLGAGDVKLLCAIGALTGPGFTLWTLFATAAAGAILGLAWAARQRALRQALENAHMVFLTRSAEDLCAVASVSQTGRMPYAPAIALGALAIAALMRLGVIA